MTSEEKNKKIKISEQLTDCLKEKEEYLKGWQRERADFINYKKDEFDRINRMSQLANREILLDLLVVLDNIERLRNEIGKRDKGFLYEGSVKIQTECMHVLKKYGVRRMVVQQKQFDPKEHEAVEVIQSDEEQEGTVLEEVSAGYWLHEEVLRPAQVKIAGIK